MDLSAPVPATWRALPGLLIRFAVLACATIGAYLALSMLDGPAHADISVPALGVDDLVESAVDVIAPPAAHPPPKTTPARPPAPSTPDRLRSTDRAKGPSSQPATTRQAVAELNSRRRTTSPTGAAAPPKAAAVLPKAAATPLGTVTSPLEKATSPLGTVTSPLGKATNPLLGKATSPLGTVTDVLDRATLLGGTSLLGQLTLHVPVLDVTVDPAALLDTVGGAASEVVDPAGTVPLPAEPPPTTKPDPPRADPPPPARAPPPRIGKPAQPVKPPPGATTTHVRGEDHPALAPRRILARATAPQDGPPSAPLPVPEQAATAQARGGAADPNDQHATCPPAAAAAPPALCITAPVDHRDAYRILGPPSRPG